jgi:hypothetical protein
MTRRGWCRGWLGSRSWAVLLAGVVGAAALASLPAIASADDACGSKDNPCPLQKWMRANMGPALANGDMPGLAKALDQAVAFSPDPSWAWAKIAKDGADAARKGDAAGAKASCKACHDAHKDKYKAQFRTKAVP